MAIQNTTSVNSLLDVNLKQILSLCLDPRMKAVCKRWKSILDEENSHPSLINNIKIATNQYREKISTEDSIIHMELPFISKARFTAIFHEIAVFDRIQWMKQCHPLPIQPKYSKDFFLRQAAPFTINQKMTNLTYLDLSRNNLKTFPSEVFQLKNLSTLDLSHNRLELDLSDNCDATRLPLRELYLSDNRISELPVWMIRLKQLQFVDFSRNQIKEIPSFLTGLKNLHGIYFQGNPIDKEMSVLVCALNRLKESPQNLASPLNRDQLLQTLLQQDPDITGCLKTQLDFFSTGQRALVDIMKYG
ncbi:MAG: leucine-rich repeat domain-containing protein [Simkaniaceae bacterium]|nr:leucine-rich repeat domain-containing protein [Simkaniaceae bacterium]